MKAEILSILRSRNDIVSGEELSAALGISRVSVWKHVHKLQDLGYQIISTSGGYRLVSSPDILFPWEYPGDAASILYFPEVTSTMDIARDLARKNCPDLTVVIAGRQTKGRGRLKRHWLSDDGGLYFTMVLRPPIPVQLSFRVNFLASLTLARVIREMLQIDAMVKWPNDILVDDRKISGMLSELEAETDRVLFINVGMGINVNNDPSQAEPGASSLNKISGREISRKDLLTRFLEEFGHCMKNADFEDVISEWKKYTVTLGRHVRIVTQREESEGLAVDVDENGALVLELANGEQKKIIYGDCFLVPEF
ncbi:Biotin operon repressor / Biotin--protein ligase (EC (EC (EC (EC [Olavius sp. associated proteobacterium Delta 1]|nr:Biotin operon repressor / Biotin--protein ligase (EC (EC (EC (EC [Olavius sp. associated proteobacterium Delta 1]